MVSPPRRSALFIVTCALALPLAACGGDEKKTAKDVPPDAIALIGDTKVPKAEFDALIARAKSAYKAQKRPFPEPGSREYQDLKTRAVAFLVQRYEYRTEAEEMGIEVRDDEVDKKVEEVKKQLFQGDEKKFQAGLKQQGLTEQQLREDILDRLLQERIYEAVTKDVKVTDEDVNEFYEKNKAQFTQPATRQVRHIVVKKKERADELYSELQDGADFAALAKRFSTDTSTKGQGGKLPITKGQTAPAFDKAAFALERGDISKPVKTQFGWHIIEAVSAVKPEKVAPLKDLEESIRQQLVQQKKNDAMKSWVERVEKEYEDKVVYAAGFEPPKTGTGTTGTTATTATE